MHRTFYGNKNLNFIYYPILKNAHSWGKEFFKVNFNFEEMLLGPNILLDSNDVSHIDKKILIFLRNPIDRWFSGVVQWFAMEPIQGKFLPNDYILDELTSKLVFSAVKLDNHTHSQKYYLSNVPLKNAVLFDCGDVNFQDNLQDYFYKVEKLPLKDLLLEKRNSTEENLLKISLKKQLTDMYNKNKKFKDSVQEYYKNDIIFYNTLVHLNKFYRKHE